MKINSEKSIAKNSLLNMCGSLFPLLFAVVTIPYVIKHLGVERFGVLSIILAILGYFQMFDFGITPALTKYISEFLMHKKNEKIILVLWTAIIFQSILIISGSIMFYFSIPFLSEKILRIPGSILDETKMSLYILVFLIPPFFISNSFKGFLAAYQRFDLINYNKIIINSSLFIIPFICSILKFKLPQIVFGFLVFTVFSLFLNIYFCIKINPNIIKKPKLQKEYSALLLRYGSWVTVTSVINPLLISADRFFIGAFRSISDVTFYSTPFEIVNRVGIIPGSIVMSLFPAFSGLKAEKNNETIKTLSAKSLLAIIILCGFIISGIILVSNELICIWISEDFAKRSFNVLNILAVGIFINSLAQVPCALLQSVGRPDIPAKFHIIELPVHLGLLFILTKLWGINGTAIAWLIRVTFDASLLFTASFRKKYFTFTNFNRFNIIEIFFVMLMLLALSFLISNMQTFSLVKILCGSLIYISTLVYVSARFFKTYNLSIRLFNLLKNQSDYR